MTEPGDKPTTRHKLTIPRNKPFVLGDLSEFMVEAKAAGAKIGMDVPAVTNEPAAATPSPSAEEQPHDDLQHPNGEPAGKLRSGLARALRRSIRVEIDEKLVKKFQYAAIDTDRTLRDLVEEAMRDFAELKLKARKAR